MSDASEPLELDLLAASLRADAADLGTFIESLAVKLEDAVPGLVVVERAKSGFRGPKVVRKLAVDAGGDRLELVSAGGDRVEARRAHISGGIVLKTEPIDIDNWMVELSAALAREAGRNQRTRQALERLLLS
jgi:hypothetical protein